MSRAWLHHKGRNKHHIEYWLDPDCKVTPMMPYKYAVECVCDKLAATKTYNGKNYQPQMALQHWEKYGKCRVYFDQNSVLSICGVEIERYKTGNVCSCYVNGASVSNSDGRRWIDGTNGCYFDVQNNEVFAPRGRFSNEIVSSIRKFLNI